MRLMTSHQFTDDVRAVASDFGVAERNVSVAPNQGQVNLTVFLGEEFVLRIGRTPRAAEQLTKEARVIPMDIEAGVPTPALVRFDSSLRVARVPYLVLERMHGVTMAERTPDAQRTLESLGEILVRLHRIRLSAIGPASTIPEPFTFSPLELLDELVEAGEIGTTQRDWLLEYFGAIRPDGPSPSDPVLVHRDVTPSNIVVGRDGRVTALLDWAARNGDRPLAIWSDCRSGNSLTWCPATGRRPRPDRQKFARPTGSGLSATHCGSTSTWRW